MRADSWPLVLCAWAAPVSITAAEFFLSVAALVRLTRIVTGRARLSWPPVLYLWLIWAGLEAAVWIASPDLTGGWSEIRHLLLLSVLFVVFSGAETVRQVRFAWQGVFVTSGLSSIVLAGQYLWKLHAYGSEIAAGGDASFYLRSGGLAGHWMVYGTVEIVVFAALVGYWMAYGFAERWMWPLALLNAVGVLLSLTRMAWVTCLCLVGVALVWKRSRWIWALPLALPAVWLAAPAAVRSRVADSLDFGYYANAERIQMLRVGWRMLGDHPFVGVGPGRVGELYGSYLADGESLPAYHGHLHNSVFQVAAQFGVPVALAALAFVFFLLRALVRATREAPEPHSRFLSDVAVLALGAFLLGGMFEYTYGHSLGLVLLALAVAPALAAPRPG